LGLWRLAALAAACAAACAWTALWAQESTGPKTGGAAETKEPVISKESLETPTRAAVPEAAPQLTDEQKNKQIIDALPNIVINRKDRTVTVDGVVCLRNGPLELFACGNGIREHEAIVSLKARPLHINTAAILMGATSGHPATWTKDEKFLPPYGPVFRVFVEYQKDGQPAQDGPGRVRVEAHEWLTDAMTDKMAKPQKWVFCGGLTREYHFLPDYEGTVVCLSNFMAPVFDVPYESTSKNSELLFKCRTEAIPLPGTPVKLILQMTDEVIEGKKLVWAITLEKNDVITLEGQPSSPKDLDEKLQKRDEYLQRIQILADPEARVGTLQDVMDVVTKYGLEIQVLRKLSLEPKDVAPGSGSSGPAGGSSAPPGTEKKP
jgi:hypothetical protein